MENLFKVKRQLVSFNRATSFVYTTVFCLAIALLLTVLRVTEPFSDTIIVSLSIGWSIQGTLTLLGSTVGKWLPAYAGEVILTGTGLAIGLAIAGWLNDGSLFSYFSENYAALILGVFFAVVGFSVFEARRRLSDANAALVEADALRQTQEKALLAAELKLLQAQIEPHFLFNTLSNVVGLIHVDPDAAEKTLLNLTVLLRSSLNRTREQTVTLAEEMTIIRAYLEIQAIRMHGRLEFRFEPSEGEMAEALRGWPLPPLLVQPLVENAIKHGIDPCETGGQVIVRCAAIADGVKIEVVDTGIGINAATQHDAGSTGLRNVRGRVQALYGENATLTLSENLPSGVKATLILPDNING
tara:strand:- start:4542 stop:5609 length:1068 start_codon:yes stop_codon:yes gene_type:complete